MKKVSLLLALFLFIPYKSYTLVAQGSSSSVSVQEVTLTKKKPPIHSGNIKRSLERQMVYAYVSNNLLTIYFTSTAPNATIIIYNELIGEIAYTGICNTGSTTIDLNIFGIEKSTTYIINISTPSWERYGKFTY